MINEKTYNGNINIGKKIVSVDTDLDFRSIVIYYVGKIRIRKIHKGINVRKTTKTIIVENIKNEKITELFTYQGVALFKKCSILDPKRRLHSLSINNSNLELWDTLTKSKKNGKAVGSDQAWESMTRFWEDMDFDGNNAKKSYIHRTLSYDRETNTYTTIKEIRKR